jgi:hypothetical protein
MFWYIGVCQKVENDVVDGGVCGAEKCCCPYTYSLVGRRGWGWLVKVDRMIK